MHLENLTFATNYTNPTVTTLPDIQCQNSPTMTTFAKRSSPGHEITSTTLIDNQNYFTFHDEHQNFLYTEQPQNRNWSSTQSEQVYPNCTNNTKLWTDHDEQQTNTNFHTELTADQLNLERQFSSAFFNIIELDQPNYDDTTLLCDFEEPIEKNTENNCSSPFYSDIKPSSSPAYSEISLSEFSPLNFISDTENLSDKDINFDIQNELSNSSFSFDLFSPAEDGEIDLDETIEEKLPSICTTFVGKNFGSMMKQEIDVTPHYSDINNFLRNSSATSIEMFPHEQNTQKNSYGHLLSAQPINNNLSEVESSCLYETYQRENNNFPTFESTNCLSENQVILTQKDAILGTTDPFLSSAVASGHSNYMQYKNIDNFTLKFNKHLSEITTSNDCNSQERNEEILEENETISDENDEFGTSMSLRQCKWAECYKQFYGETLLVKHIEKFHVEIKRGDEFACFWENCPRKTKPFNARYKLLIHMRVHSGEKPNKCSWPRCNKAFSRLENLKIHQRSHTGERPYKCQHGGCHKAFSNSSDRAKHQRTHVDTKPYACQVANCLKRYTDPSSLRKHVKNHSLKEQAYVKRRQKNIQKLIENSNLQNEELQKTYEPTCQSAFNETSSTVVCDWKLTQRHNIRQDLKNKIMMNDKVRKMNEKMKSDDNIVDETFQNVVSSSTVKHFDNSEFIPYESVQRLFSDKIDYVATNEIYDAIF